MSIPAVHQAPSGHRQPRVPGTPLRLRWSLAGLLALAGCATPPSAEPGLALLREGQPREGLAALQRASNQAPGDASLRSQWLLQLERHLAQRSADGAAALARQDVAAARAAAAELRALAPADERGRVLAADAAALEAALPAITRGQAAVARGALDEAQAAWRAAQAIGPQLAPVLTLQAALEQARADARDAAQRHRDASSVLTRPVSLTVRDANLRATLEALARQSGLNLVLDNEVKRDARVSVTVNNAPLADVLDLLLLQGQLAKRTLGANALYVYPATESRLREQQELDVRSFHVAHADLKQVANSLRTLLKLRDVVIDERSGLLLLREPPAVLDVAERIVRAQDRAEPEVMLELEVLEVSRDRLSQLGLRLPDAVSINLPAGSAPGGGSTVGELRALTRDDLQVSPLGVGVNLRLTDTDANLLASPRIRARHRQPARVMIGDKVPVITNSVTPLQSGNAVVTGAIQYLDVGIKLQVEPEVYPDAQVGIRMNLEVSNIAREIAGPSGSLAYQIGTRNAETMLRLRDGETQILAGLISDQARQAASKVPGLGQLPLLGRLFSSVNGNGAKTEIVLSITPRILRPVAVLPPSLQQFPSGTEAQVRPRALTLDTMPAAAGSAAGPQAAPWPPVSVQQPSGGAAATANAAAVPAPAGQAGATGADGAAPHSMAPGSDPAAVPSSPRRTRPAERLDVPAPSTR